MSRIKDLAKKNALRLRRKRRIRGKIDGCAAKPRLTVFKSNKFFYAQAIDDVAGVTLAAVDSRAMKLSVNKENVVKVAAVMAENLKANNIETVVFDKNGYLYHGVIASFADALRDNGIRV
ncbi:MAG: 50S ribosomal protein L18 [Epsilonproteobacteria bacterium]|nr:50S ribosomal protein L18 [Campylobacterota bacterium]